MRPRLAPLILAAVLGAAAAVPARAEVATSILPLHAWATELLGGSLKVDVLIGAGQTPELFEPSARQMTGLASARLLFTVGAPFEQTFVPRAEKMFEDLRVVALGSDLPRRPMDAGHRHDGDFDPHIWLDPSNAASIIVEMGEVLARHYSTGGEDIRARAQRLAERFRSLDLELRAHLEPLRGQDLLCHHPALGYFADAYGLNQVAVEEGGTEPGARHLTRLAERIHQQRLKVLVIEPQFAPQRARAMANSMDLELIVFDPLGEDLQAGLRDLATQLIDAFGVEQP